MRYASHPEGVVVQLSYPTACARCDPPDSSAPSCSTLAPVRHRWLPDKMAISSLRSIMWKHSNNLAVKHQLVNALVSHASAVRFLGVN